MMTFTSVRGGVLISDPGLRETFSLQLLDELDARYATYDRDTGLITLTGVNRTVVYQVDGEEPPHHMALSAHLVSDTPN